jgi:O-antigen biosynthesis protein
MHEGFKALVITTFNREDSFKKLYESIPFHELDWVIVVNAGEPYKGDYDRPDGFIWYQVEGEKNIAETRNIGLKLAKDLGVEHIFLTEDDMIIKSDAIFDEYLRAARVSGLKYFCFTSYAWESGPPGKRTPRITVEI